MTANASMAGRPGAPGSAPGHRPPAPAGARAAAAYRLRLTGVIVGSGAALSAAYAVAGIGLPCPLRQLTGINCPLCGGTRMGAALLHVDPVAAFVYNPLALLGLVGLVLACIGWLVQLATDRTPRPLALIAGSARAVAAIVPGWARWSLLGLLAVAYALGRTFVWPIPA